MTKYILTRLWQSKTGYQERLYLGYNELDHIDCIPDKDKALVMSEEDANEWKNAIRHGELWTIEAVEIPEEKKEGVTDNGNSI